MKRTMNFKVGSVVEVVEHDIEQHLVGNSVVSNPRLRRHAGYKRAVVTSVFKDGAVEVKVGGGFDYVPAKFVRPLAG